MDELHFSRLKLMGRSPAHYVAYVDEDSASLRAGRALHSAILGGNHVVCYPDRRAGKKWEAFEADHPDYTILSETEHERVAGMARSVMRHAYACKVLGSPGMRFEEEFTWTIGDTVCAGRIDAYSADVLAELKSTKYGRPSWFCKEALSRAYHAQVSWYRNGISCGKPVRAPSQCYIIAVESVDPYPTTVWKLTDAALLVGEKIWCAWLEQLRVCQDSNTWPGYVPDSACLPLDVPDEPELTFADEMVEVA